MVYRDVNVTESLAQRLNLDLAQPFVKITGLNKQTNYSIQFEQTGSCSENQKTGAVYVVAGQKGKAFFPTFQFIYFVESYIYLLNERKQWSQIYSILIENVY